MQASFFYSVEDGARFRGMDSALRQNLREGLQDGLDDVIVSGTNGLLTGTNLPDNDVSTQTTYALYRSQFNHGRVDGRYASRSSDIRIVFGSATFVHAASQYRGNNDNHGRVAIVDGRRLRGASKRTRSRRIRQQAKRDCTPRIADGCRFTDLAGHIDCAGFRNQAG